MQWLILENVESAEQTSALKTAGNAKERERGGYFSIAPSVKARVNWSIAQTNMPIYFTGHLSSAKLD
jgi:hypothetical protein